MKTVAYYRAIGHPLIAEAILMNIKLQLPNTEMKDPSSGIVIPRNNFTTEYFIHDKAYEGLTVWANIVHKGDLSHFYNFYAAEGKRGAVRRQLLYQFSSNSFSDFGYEDLVAHISTKKRILNGTYFDKYSNNVKKKKILII